MVTRLGLYGGPRSPYGNFTGKTAAAVTAPPKRSGPQLNRTVGRLIN